MSPVMAKLSGKAGTKKLATAKKAATKPKKAASGTVTVRKGGAGYRRFEGVDPKPFTVPSAPTSVHWVDAGKVELDGAQYFNLALPFTLTQLIWIEAILVGGAELYRNSELDLEKRCYPGGIFDPLKLASNKDEQSRRLKEAEIKHGRLAMVSFLGYAVQALVTGEGALGSLSLFAKNLSGA